MFLPVTEIFVTKEARNIVFSSRIGVPVEASISECMRGSFIGFRVWPLDTDGEGFGSRGLCDFSCQPERLLSLQRAKHWVRHRSFAVVFVVAVGGVDGWTRTRPLSITDK